MSLWGKTLSRVFLPSLVASLSVLFPLRSLCVYCKSVFPFVSLFVPIFLCLSNRLIFPFMLFFPTAPFSDPRPLPLSCVCPFLWFSRSFLSLPLAFCVRLICTFHWVCKSILLSRLPSSICISNEAEDVTMGIRLWKWAQVSHCDSWPSDLHPNTSASL